MTRRRTAAVTAAMLTFGLAASAWAAEGGTPAAAAAPAAPAAPTQQAPLLNAAAGELPKVFAVQIHVADMARSEHFYQAAFGAQVHKVRAGESALQFPAGPMIILVQGQPREAAAPLPAGAGGFLLQVGDIDAAFAHVTEAGGRVVRAPNSGEAAQSFGVRAGVIRDPDGVQIEVIQRPAK